MIFNEVPTQATMLWGIPAFEMASSGSSAGNRTDPKTKTRFTTWEITDSSACGIMCKTLCYDSWISSVLQDASSAVSSLTSPCHRAQARKLQS